MSEDFQRAQGVALLFWSVGPESPNLLATPFALAATAAAMDVPVELYFTGRSVQLLMAQVAQRLCMAANRPDTVADAMRMAVEQGAVLLACSDALAVEGIDRTRLVPECTDLGGTVQYMARAADLRWRTLVF